jgi:hypothetical protein
MRNATPLLGVALFLASCTSERAPDGLDADRVLHMAGEEAGQIPNPTARLTRQLNIAFRQIGYVKLADARTTLAQARKTLESTHDAAVHDQPPIGDHDRLAGWISLSELSRDAQDPATANVAVDRALAHLNKIEPAHARCEYVPGIAKEVRELRGDKPAAALLVTAGEWATKIPELPTRRSAYLAFATELFRANDYEAARQLLRRDEDATWRADALTAVSDVARYDYYGRKPGSFVGMAMGRGATGASESSLVVTRSPATQPGDKPFGKPLDFKSTFYRQN